MFQHKKLPGEGEGDIQGDDGQYLVSIEAFLDVSSVFVMCPSSPF